METDMRKFVYTFGAGSAEGNTTMKNLLGGKGANLAEMSKIGVPVPPGFTITTEACTQYNEIGRDQILHLMYDEIKAAVKHIETVMGSGFGHTENPLLVSVRSGARVSMPGMMDTVLNLGLNPETAEGLAKRSGDPRFAWDSYRRFVQMYGDVVMGLKPENKEDPDPFEELIHWMKIDRGVQNDTDLTTEDLKDLTAQFKTLIKEKTGEEFPTDPWKQLYGSIIAVFESWNNDRAKVYRLLNHIPEEWGTAVNVQAMVYGNLSSNSATGVAFTRDAGTGEDIFNGEFLFNAQGEDVVAGIRTPQQVTLEGSRRWAMLAEVSEAERKEKYPSLEEVMPEVYAELSRIETQLENHYSDMQDLEFTVQEGELWILQTRNGKRTGTAQVKIAMDMLRQRMIDERTAVQRVDPTRLDDLLHPVFDEQGLRDANTIAKGLPASPGAATGQIVFFADEAHEWAEEGKEVILVRVETSPEDLKGMNAAKGILTARGGMTSHAAVVARGMGKCCVSGAGAVHVDYHRRVMTIEGVEYPEGAWISLNGSTGAVIEGKVPTTDPKIDGDLGRLLDLADKYAKLEVRTNADMAADATVAEAFGAKGIGLCRTEHMFFLGERIIAMREMILASDKTGRLAALDKLLPIQRADFTALFEVMHDRPVTVRLFDPPLHEFVPHDLAGQQEIADDLGIPVEAIQEKVEALAEANPMMGHRGCRLGITYPEITQMQTRAIIEAAMDLKERGIVVFPEIMVPLVTTVREFFDQEKLIRSTAEKVFTERNDRIDFHIGTMIETPRAAMTAGYISQRAEFFSFGTNDLTQMSFGFSRDDAGRFLPEYLKKGLLDHDPFQQLDERGVGRLIRIAVEEGRQRRPDLPIGICGEHGGNPSSIELVHKVGLNYVSCSPFRVPIARLAAAQAALRDEDYQKNVAKTKLVIV